MATTFAVLVAVVGGDDRVRAQDAPVEAVLDVLVTDTRGVAIAGATVRRGTETAVTDHWGRARLNGASPGAVVVDHDRFGRRVVHRRGTGERLWVPLGSPVLRAVHVAGTLVDTARWDDLVALVERTALNAFMLDIKDESGRVFPVTSSSWAIAAGAATDRWDLAEVTTDLHARGIEVIGRIVAFQDPIAGNALPDLAVRTVGGSVFSRRGQTFLDATDPDAREYALQLAEEACAAGIDEVQFDYVRYPDSDQSSLVFDGGNAEDVRVGTIVGFLAEAKARVGPGCRIAADIFGFVTSVPHDGGIGHHLESLARTADVLSPMVYPDHWGPGWFGFARPVDHPGGVIDGSMRDAIVRTGGLTTLRPWLQDFRYGPAEVRAQIDAADALGLGWMLWNAGSVFTEAAIPTEAEVRTPSAVPAAVEQSLPSSRFWDVPSDSPFSADVAWLAAEGITQGCNPPWRDDYCPARALTRAEAATLMARVLDLPPAAADRFVDDEHTGPHEADIDALAAAGLVEGCAFDRFCPDEPLTRAELASLVAGVLDLPDAATDTFVDDDTSAFEAEIERLAAAGITRGCSDTEFCPTRPVRRDEAAAFLHRAFG